MVFASAQLPAEEKFFTVNNLAVGGVDMVSYFTDGKPSMGRKEYSTQWKKVEWRFSSEQHLSMFKKEPSRFVPQFGGFCSLTTAHGASIPINPMAWAIHDERLYFFVFEAARDTWLMNPEKLIKRANTQWPN
jgi:YHS domain-containing protein